MHHISRLSPLHQRRFRDWRSLEHVRLRLILSHPSQEAKFLSFLFRPPAIVPLDAIHDVCQTNPEIGPIEQWLFVPHIEGSPQVSHIVSIVHRTKRTITGVRFKGLRLEQPNLNILRREMTSGPIAARGECLRLTTLPPEELFDGSYYIDEISDSLRGGAPAGPLRVGETASSSELKVKGHRECQTHFGSRLVDHHQWVIGSSRKGTWSGRYLQGGRSRSDKSEPATAPSRYRTHPEKDREHYSEKQRTSES